VGIKPSLRREQTDASIIEESLQRPQAFAVLFDRHFDQIHRYLARRLGHDRADDVAAGTFAVAFERRATFRDDVDALPWLFGIATNLLRNEWRAERRALNALAELTVSAARSSTSDGTGAEGVGIAELLAELDADQRDVLLLHAWEGFSYQEIAAALRVPIGTVRSRLARARARLRPLIDGGPRRRGPRLHRNEVTE
jgi:RNA polymerase sigma factor (sigma-70 family)